MAVRAKHTLKDGHGKGGALAELQHETGGASARKQRQHARVRNAQRAHAVLLKKDLGQALACGLRRLLVDGRRQRDQHGVARGVDAQLPKDEVPDSLHGVPVGDLPALDRTRERKAGGVVGVGVGRVRGAVGVQRVGANPLLRRGRGRGGRRGISRGGGGRGRGRERRGRGRLRGDKCGNDETRRVLARESGLDETSAVIEHEHVYFHIALLLVVAGAALLLCVGARRHGAKKTGI